MEQHAIERPIMNIQHKSLSRIQKQAGLFIFVVLSLSAVVYAQTAPVNIRFEAESGSLTGGVSSSSDPLASGGNYLSFFQQAPPGPVGVCGLVGEVFCENFEQGPVATANRGRSGDFDGSKISATRLMGNQYEGSQDHINWIGRAEIPEGCRAGSVTNPLPPDDTLICNANSAIGTKYGFTATAAQNYGDNYYRIAQQFDIAGRTGTIAFDASLHTYNGILGYTAIAFSSDPIASPTIRADNGNGISMKEGVFISFYCQGGGVIVRKYSNYVETEVTNQLGWCFNSGITTRVGSLNRVQVRVSQGQMEIYATNYSNNGTTFGTPVLLFRGDPGLSFTRGYVGFGGHNHATVKYSFPNSDFTTAPVYSQNVVWDNIAFDGPAITPERVYQAPDSNVALTNGLALGYHMNLITESPMAPITIKSVNLAGATSARLSLNSYLNNIVSSPTTFKLHYRLNGGTWHELVVPTAIRNLIATNNSNRFNLLTDVALSELRAGDNTIQFAVEGVNNSGYAPFVANIDLLVR